MNSPTITMIGAGNMGSSIIGGLISNGHPANKIWATDPDQSKLDHLANLYHIHSSTNNQTAIKQSEIVIFAIKPQIFNKVAKPLAAIIQEKKPLVLSIAAGVRTTMIEQWLGGNIAVVRVMPNTPALIGAGAAGLYANHLVSQTQKNNAESIMRAVGIALWVDAEEKIDTITALSGSGPAYFFLFMESLHQAAIQCGLDDETAKLLTVQTALGAAKMAIESELTLPELRKNVTSPGGTTEKGIAVLEDNHLRDILQSAITAAKNRSIELAQTSGDTDK